MYVCVQAHLRDIADLVLDHCNKVNITIWIFLASHCLWKLHFIYFRDMKWGNAVGKMLLIDLLYSELPQTFNL